MQLPKQFSHKSSLEACWLSSMYYPHFGIVPKVVAEPDFMGLSL